MPFHAFSSSRHLPISLATYFHKPRGRARHLRLGRAALHGLPTTGPLTAQSNTPIPFTPNASHNSSTTPSRDSPVVLSKVIYSIPCPASMRAVRAYNSRADRAVDIDTLSKRCLDLRPALDDLCVRQRSTVTDDDQTTVCFTR